MLKRLFDLFVAISVLMLTSPIITLCTVILYIIQGRPILFGQPRPGLHGKIFTLYKFRSMKDDKDQQGNLLPDEQRLTRFGQFIRKTSIDELPGLWSVIKGDMSLVGPRPLLVEYLPLYSPEQARRHQVKPGITGWAQINGRNQLSWQEKFELDVWYVDNQSWVLDMKILFGTITKVFFQTGINAEGEATMSKFTGDHE